MNLFAKTVILIAAIFLVVGVIAATYLRYHDTSEKRALLQIVHQELRPQAGMSEMEDFMRRHTSAYAFDQYHNELGGFLPQTRADKLLFDRRIGLYLKRRVGTNTLEKADVRVYYTYL